MSPSFPIKLYITQANHEIFLLTFFFLRAILIVICCYMKSKRMGLPWQPKVNVFYTIILTMKRFASPLQQYLDFLYTTNNGAFLENLSNKKLTSLKVALYLALAKIRISRGYNHNKSYRMNRKR